jgi:hypothetical protein
MTLHAVHGEFRKLQREKYAIEPQSHREDGEKK